MFGTVFGTVQTKPQVQSVRPNSGPSSNSTIQPTFTSSTSEQLEESPEIMAALTKIETIIHDWKDNLTNLGISEDLKSEKQYIKYIKIYMNLIKDNVEKKTNKNYTKFQSNVNPFSEFQSSVNPFLKFQSNVNPFYESTI
jgi:hypothetical protein